MKIAVPTNDGLSISEHFGRSAGFLVFETENDRIVSSELRKNQGLEDHEGSSCGGDPAVEPHSHGAILLSLTGCDVVICAGMGARAAEALKQEGVREVVFTHSGLAAEAVEAYLKGRLQVSSQQFCRCSH
ncbi:MAG TPA: NifB/NifX family molybdenum-iron cluster-binding protein [Bryobacteraceae bacterium]|nr:NifB/NifX family molybdenum-iron cluster-binding protein [Bryobacteraceae bacterium]